MATRIQLRRDTAADWTSVNPVLAQGEPGLEVDTGRIKYGDGATAWSSLPYGPELPSTGGAGAPVAGTWKTDQIAVDTAGRLWVCTAGGTPGTWVLPTEALAGALLAANNLSDVASPSTALATLSGVAKAGSTMTGPLVLSGDPTTPLGAATKQYVDAVAAGLSPKTAVKALSATNVASLSGTPTIDGYATVAADRVLLTGQTTASQNGIWVVAAGAWARPADFAAGSSQQGTFTFVELGSTYAGSGFVMTGVAVVVDTGAETWVQFSGAGEITAGANLTKTGNTLALQTSPALTGAPTAPTPAPLDATTKLATTAYADAATAVEKARALAAEAAAIATAEAASDPVGSATTALATATGRAVAFAIVFGS